LKPKDLSKFLTQAIPAHMPILIKGAPGVGKTDIITQACEKTDTELLISHPVVDEPIDYKGLPAIKDDHAEFLPFGSLRKLIETKQPTVYFMDDLGQALPAVQAAAMQLILARRINGFKVSDEVTFIAATNRKQDKAGVAGILEPVKSRFVSIVELEPDIEDWVFWATKNNFPAELIAFIRFRPQLLFDFTPSVEMKNSPCPRTVCNVGKLMQLGLCPELEFEAYAGAAGEGFAAELMGFLQIYRKLPDPKLVLLNPEGVSVPDDPATLYAVTGALSRLAKPENIQPMVIYANRLPAEFSVLLMTDAEKQNSAIVNTRAYAMWAARHHKTIN
jgi:ATPase family protein associated with various cellular activities (AAA)